MNDTHGAEGKGWYAFDLDGTLAVYDTWKGIDHIGEPVKPMVARIKKLHAAGKRVKILTARVAPRPNPETKPNPHLHNASPDANSVYGRLAGIQIDPGAGTVAALEAFYKREEWDAKMFIIDWCVGNLGFVPEITHEKDHLMLELYDDRVKQVVPNEGLLVEDLYREAVSMLKKVNADTGWLVAKLESKRNGFWAGFGLAVFMFIVSGLCIEAYEKWFGPEKEPTRIRMEKAHDAICDLLKEWPTDIKMAK